LQDTFHANQYASGLLGVAARTNLKVLFGVGQFQLLEEDSIEIVRIVLARVQNEIVGFSTFQRPDNRRHFDNLGSRAQHHGDFHLGLFLLKSFFTIITTIRKSTLKPCLTGFWVEPSAV
jgi:hypothetical protein